MIWFQFTISAAVIIFAGIQLTVYADKLSDELKLSKVWIGVCLLGLVTSLPEAVTSLVSIVSLQAVDLAVGNLLGSNNFNPMLIVVMDLIYRKGAVTNAINPDRSHKISAWLAITLICIVIGDILFNVQVLKFSGATLSAGSIMIAICYFGGIIRLARLNKGEAAINPSLERPADRKHSIAGICFQLLISTVLVVIGAIWLARSADVIAVQTGLGGTFFGSIFLAFVTSLPEMVVSLSALKLGSLDLAIGNIFGSNMTNVFIVFICSLFYRGGSLLGDVSQIHILTASLSILLTFIALKGILVRNKRTVFGLGLDSLVMIVLFIVGTSLLYYYRTL